MLLLSGWSGCIPFITSPPVLNLTLEPASVEPEEDYLWVPDDWEEFPPLEASLFLVFVDATFIQAELDGLLEALSNVGIVVFMVISGLGFLLSSLLIRPTVKAFSQQKQFIADASHELKTPLMIIRSNFAALKANEDETVKSQMEWLDYMEFGFDRMANLTQDLLLIAKLEDLNFMLKKEPFDMSELTRRTLQAFKTKNEEKGLTVDMELPERLELNQDADRLGQVLVILLDNAIKYADVSGWVKIHGEIQRNKLKFSIKNSGPGIAPEKLPHTFERFYRGDASRKTDGGSYGLGLAIAQSIIQKSGGKIEVSSIENVETEFRFTIKI